MVQGSGFRVVALKALVVVALIFNCYFDAGAAEISLSRPPATTQITQIEFGTMGINSPRDVTLSIANSGLDTLAISLISITGNNSSEFSVTAGGSQACSSMPPSIPGGSSCSIMVTFSPSAKGIKNAVLQVESNAAAAPSLSVPLEGVADDPTVTLSIDGTGTGTVSYVFTVPGGSPSASVSCSQNCYRQFPAGTALTVTPSSGANSRFSGWQGCPVAGPQPQQCSATLDRDTTVTAIFSDTTPVQGGASLVQKIADGNCYLSNVAVDGDNPLHVVANGECGFYRSSDGSSFTKTSGGRFFTLAMDRLNPMNIYGGTDYVLEGNGSIYSSHDGGTTFSTVNLGNVGAIAVDPTDSNNVFLSTQLVNGIYRKQGTAWTKIVSPDIDTTYVNWLHLDRDGVLYAGTNSKGLMRSYDKGSTWQPVSVKNATKVIYIKSHPADTNLLVSSLGGTVAYLSRDKGASWSLISGTIGNFTDFEFLPSDPGILYSSTYLGVYASHDDGITWQLVAGVRGGDLELVPDSAPQQFYVVGDVVATHLNSHVYKSEPLGLSVVPGKLNLGTVNTHNDSATQVLTLTNHSNAVPPVPVSLSALTVTGGATGNFSVEQGDTLSCLPLPRTLAQGESCTVTVMFDPATGGNKAATLAIASDDTAFPLIGVALSGYGVATPPIGSVAIVETSPISVPNVTAEFSVTDISGSTEGALMRTSTDGRTWASWQAFHSSGTFALPSGDGPKTLYVQYLSPNGGISKAYGATVTLETKPPATTILPVDPRPLSNNLSPVFRFTADEPVQRFECSLDGGAFALCTSPSTFAGLTDGPHTLSARAIDMFGTTGPEAIFSWAIDATPPDTLLSATSAPYGTAVQLTFSSPDSSATFECSQNNGVSWSSCTSPLTLSGFVPGTHSFMVRAKDELGNVDPTPALFTWQTECIARIGATCYSSLGAAYANAPTGSLIQVLGIQLPDMGFQTYREIVVMIEGGYISGFSAVSTQMTSLAGGTSISTGTVTLSGISLN